MLKKKRDKKLPHAHVRDDSEKSWSSTTASVKKKMKIIACIDYIVNNIKNYDNYDFRHYWNRMAVHCNLGRVIDAIDEKEITRNKIDGIEDNEKFEDSIRIGVQALIHAFYPKEWEALGPILYPREGVFDI